jgi:drug/metabolite transporter (DMT)-like permease
MRPSSSLHNLLTLLFLSLLWSSSLPAIKIAVAETGPITLAASRACHWVFHHCLPAAFPWPVCMAGASSPPAIYFCDESRSVCVCPSILFHVQNWLLRRPQPVCCCQLGRFLRSLLAHFLLRTERLTWSRFGGVFIGFMGIVILLGRDASSIPHAGLSAQAMVILATMGYVSSTLMARHLPEVPALFFALMMLFFVALVMVPMALLFETPAPPNWPRHIWQAVIWLGLISTGLAFCLRFYLIRNVGAGYASFVGYLIPLLSVLLGALILHEPVGPTKIVATLLILLGLGLTQKAQAPSLLRRR